MIKEPCLPLFDLAICISDACDLVSSALAHHHKQVAYISYRIGKMMGLSGNDLADLVLAAAMHDIGALSLQERIEIMEFESVNVMPHAELGSALLRHFAPAIHIAEIVRWHHQYWDGSNDTGADTSQVPLSSYILHLADRVALLIDMQNDVIGQIDNIREKLSGKRGTMFSPDVFDAFEAVSHNECFWLDAVSPSVYRILRKLIRMQTLTLDLRQLDELSILFSRIIDFRSRYTATHSAGVATVAMHLAGYAGFSRRECEYMRIAGLLHDLGKLAVPREILEKPGSLDKREYDLIRSHTYYTYRILDTLDDFETINEWGAFHHERLNGSGYPFHHQADDLSLGSRIMAVADIFTAITEDRPYRGGINPDESLGLLLSMGRHGLVDLPLVELLKKNSDTINDARIREQRLSKELYDAMLKR